MIKDRLCITLLLLITTTLYSCKDSKLAKEMEGSWKTSYVTSYEDGTKSYVDEQITFKNDDPNKYGGSFFEIRTGKEELDEDEVNVKYRWFSRIEGTWEINIDNLVINYNISTLEVEVEKDDVDFDFKGEAFLWNDWGSLIARGFYMNNNLYKKLKKSTYKDMFRYYGVIRRFTNDNGFSYTNVQINSSTLSYQTSDMGRIEFSRVINKMSKKQDNGVKIDLKENQDESFSDDENDSNNLGHSDYTYHFSGFIDKYGVSMFLNINNKGNVSGYYYYESQGSGKRISLSGQMTQEEDYHLILNCDNQDIFDGYVDDNKYSGEFTNTNDKRLYFNLHKLL